MSDPLPGPSSAPPPSPAPIEGLVSVVLPTYNRAHIVRRAIDSVLKQSYAELELIVIDDCSTDETADVITEAAEGDGRIRPIFLERNVGVQEVRNPGLEAARGEFLAFIDSDDTWMPWKVEAQLEVFRRLPEVGMCWSDMVAVDGRGREVHPRYLRRMYAMYERYDESGFFDEELEIELPAPARGRAPVRHGQIYRWMFLGNIVHTPTVMTRRAHMDPNQRFDLPYRAGEDHAFHLTTSRGTRSALLDVPSIRYQIGEPDQVTAGDRGLEFAQAYLTVLRREVELHGDTLGIDEGAVNEAFAQAHAWLGSALLAEDRRRARAELLESLRRRPRIDKRLKFLVYALLPRRLHRAARAGATVLRRR